MRFKVVVLVLFLIPGLLLAQAREDVNADEPFVSEDSKTGNPYRPTAVLYDNGPLATCSGCGAGGADESMLQSTSLGMNTLGWGHQFGLGFRVADDFTIADPMGWDIDTFTFYAYQTGSPTTSSMIGVTLRIFDAPPPGGTVVFGDTGSNVMTGTTWSNIYRTTETTIGATNRPIMMQTISLGAPLHLDPGTYWLDWNTDGTLGSGPWAPPVTVIGTCITGNGVQSIDGAGAVYGPALDSGTGACQQDFPFIIEGEVTGGVPTTPAWGLALLALALLGAGYYALWRRQHA